MALEDVVSELESLGAVGNGAASEVHSKITLPSPPSLPVDILPGSDERAAKMVTLTRKAVSLMDTIIETQIALRELFVEIHDLWAEPAEEPEEEAGAVEAARESAPDAALEIEDDDLDEDLREKETKEGGAPLVEAAKAKARETGNAILDILAQEEANGYRLEKESDSE
jgi:hypothetical protein